MRGKLVKRINGIRWDLYLEEDIDQLNTIASSDHSALGKLSLKNCQSIERGYDLDELAYSDFPNGTYETSELDLGLDMYKEGFQKALELIGDKKFSEQDMYKMFDYARSIDTAKKHIKKLEDKPIDEFFNDFIQSLQQTEWDVEVEMRSKDIDELRESNEGFLNNPNLYVPKLDADGCLILKRI